MSSFFSYPFLFIVQPYPVTVRFSFSKHNTKEEIDIIVDKLKEMI